MSFRNLLRLSDSEVYRLGYGEPAGIEIVVAAAKNLGAEVRRQPGVRIGLIIADNETLVYSPTPLLVEAGPNSKSPGANAIRLGSPTAALRSDLALDGRGEAAIGRVPLDEKYLAKVTRDLQANPPRRFDVARTERVFNAKFEFVEFELHDTFLDRKKVQIPAEFLGLARDEQTKRLLTTTFKLVGSADTLSGGRLQRGKKWIVQTYLTNLPGYGNVVLRTVKPDFERRVEQLRRCIVRFGRLAERRLQDAMDKNRDALVNALLPGVLKNPPGWWKKYGPRLTEEEYRGLLAEELRAKFGDASRLIGLMRVTLLFKAVTYESLVDEKFQSMVKQKLPLLETTHEEHRAAPESLFDLG